MKASVFDTPKPPLLIKRICQLAQCRDQDVILDFFAGSCATADAVMQLNSEDGEQRRYIMVQMAEPCDKKSEAFSAGFGDIAELAKERLRRAGNKIKHEVGADDNALDIGFRVFKIDSTNMKDVYYAPDQVTQEGLFGQIDNIKEDRGDEDLLSQVLLDWGVDLSSPIESEKIAGKSVYFVDEDALAACFEADIEEDFVKALAERKPLRAVFRDSGYGSDSTKINVEQIVKLISPTTEVKTL